MIDKIRHIKYSRLKLEERYVLDVINNLTSYINNDYPFSIFFKNNNITLFQWDYKTGYFWCNYTDFWSILQSKFNMDYFDVKNLIKYMISEFLLKSEIRPVGMFKSFPDKLKQIKKDIEPMILSIPNQDAINYSY